MQCRNKYAEVLTSSCIIGPACSCLIKCFGHEYLETVLPNTFWGPKVSQKHLGSKLRPLVIEEKGPSTWRRQAVTLLRRATWLLLNFTQAFPEHDPVPTQALAPKQSAASPKDESRNWNKSTPIPSYHVSKLWGPI